MSAEMKKLPDSELEVMQAVWACQEVAASENAAGQESASAAVSRKDIEEHLKGSYEIALTTLLTLLTRLADKGFLRIEKVGRSAQYIPLITQQEYQASQSKRFLDKVCGGSLSAFATALCDSGLTKEDIAELRDLMERGML